MKAAIQQPEGTSLEDYRDGLYRRLEAGYARIDQGQANGEDVWEWENFWLALLSEYERVCRDLQRDLSA